MPTLPHYPKISTCSRSANLSGTTDNLPIIPEGWLSGSRVLQPDHCSEVACQERQAAEMSHPTQQGSCLIVLPDRYGLRKLSILLYLHLHLYHVHLTNCPFRHPSSAVCLPSSRHSRVCTSASSSRSSCTLIPSLEEVGDRSSVLKSVYMFDGPWR